MSRAPDGLEFPPGSKNDRSSTEANKKVWHDACAAVDAGLAERIEKEKNWRFGYAKYIREHVKVSLQSPEKALKGAQAGLDTFYNTFEFVRDGEACSVEEAMAPGKFTGTYETGFVQGKGSLGDGYEVPYKDKVLRGDALKAQIRQWAEYGTIEGSCADALCAVVDNGSWANLKDRYFVLLGAGAAMGPFLVLMALGANVIACDLDRDFVWKRLVPIAEASPGTLTFPLKKPQAECATSDELYQNAGCNIISRTPEIANWLCSLYPGQQLTIGSYVYLDGAFFVRVSLACDAIMRRLCESRRDTAIAFLCTPTDCHAIPMEAHKAALHNYSNLGWKNLVLMPIRVLSSKMLVKNAPPPVKTDAGSEIAFVDGIVVPQGPNYALAKRMQHWRAMVARSQGHVVSTNIAPSTSTLSVVKNRSFAWAYDGMPFFTPMEIFGQETSNAVMAGLLLHDINNANSAAHPSFALENPLQLFSHGSFHGGVWRCGYTVGSIGEVSVLIHFVKVLRPVLLIALLVALFAIFWQ
eukprot:TRINITY_DN339_c0_g1_i1.p1 TRINITY_DN339_c0_g1~~TRINITY_DN339_c0_g1_i1.p1  ORF type:complete len:550 (-),score=181.39 TRINITY_DN339_c0_g1_i1:68-1639(-)